MAVNLFDTYLSKIPVNRKDTSLLFVTCIFIAAKFEEVKIVRLKNFMVHCDNKDLTHDAVLEMEKKVLELLDYKLTYICPYDFLKRVFFIYRTDLDKC